MDSIQMKKFILVSVVSSILFVGLTPESGPTDFQFVEKVTHARSGWFCTL